MPAIKQRFIGLDVARTWAMLLALLAHCFVKVGVYPHPAISMIVRTSTPTFIILFGAMISIVYISRFELHGIEKTLGDSFTRSVQCYALFCVNIIALAISDEFSMKYTLLCIAMVGVTPYAGILQYYTIMFFLLPFIIMAARKINLYMLFAVTAGVHLLYPLLKMMPNPPPLAGQPVFSRALSLMLGTGRFTEIAGPSILHSLVFIVAGLWFGRALNPPSCASDGIKNRPSLILLVASFVGMAIYAVYLLGTRSLNVEEFGSMHLRNLNHPAYIFVVGGVSLLMIIVLSKVCQNLSLPAWCLALGRRSLFAFGWGNVVIVSWPDSITQIFGPSASCALLFAITCLMTTLYDLALRTHDGPSNLVARTSHWLFRLAEKVGFGAGRKIITAFPHIVSNRDTKPPCSVR